MKKGRFRFIFLLGILLPMAIASASETELPSKKNVVAVAKKINDNWIARHLDPGNNEWPRATYFAGNIELYKVTRKKAYLDYAIKWAENNKWAVNGGPATSNADNHACGQVYIDLYRMDDVPVPAKIEAIKNAIDYRIANNPQSSDWWWVDAMFMAMPTITKLGVVCNDSNYLDKLYALFHNTRDTLIVNSGWSQASSEKYAPGPIVSCPTCGNESDGLYNKVDGLWWRDWRYQPGVPPQNSKPKQSPNGKNIYWSRGNGWTLAALARTLQSLPATDAHRAEYSTVFTEMAAALKNCQRTDGFWNMNLADAEHYPAPETSGTAFFTYGLAWGINNGFLDTDTYYPVVAKAWNGLVALAIESGGNVRYAQNVGEAPIDPSLLTASSVDFAVGAVLLAASEVAQLAFDDGLPDDGDPDENDILLDRTDWTIITSSEGAADGAVGGNDPQYIIDGDTRSAFLFVKPGNTYNGVTVAGGTNPWFAIDLKQSCDMTHLFYRHRDYNNTTALLRANKASFYGKNAETDEFLPIIENVELAVDDAEVRIDFPEKVAYRYVKFVYEAWVISGGYTIQISEFNLGNTLSVLTEIPDVPFDRQASIYPNPVLNGQLILDNGQLKVGEPVQIFALNGSPVLTGKVSDAATTIIDVSTLPAGSYVVKAGNRTAKFINN